MAHSKRFKDQSSSARRVATSINKLVEVFDAPSIIHKSAGISQADRDVLLKAATILRRIGSEKAKQAKIEKANELQRAKLIEQATVAAGRIIASWGAPETILDKVSLILGTSFGYSLERYLIEGISVWNRDVVAKDWSDTFNDIFNDALKDIPTSAGYHAVTIGKPIEEVMITASEKITAIKTGLKAKNLAERWAAKMNP